MRDPQRGDGQLIGIQRQILPDEIADLIEDTDAHLLGDDQRRAGVDLLPDEVLRHCISVQTWIADIVGEPLHLPPAVEVRVLSNELDRHRRLARSVEERRMIRASADNRRLHELSAMLPRRPKYRPRKHLAARMAEMEALAEFKERRLALRDAGLSSYAAVKQAAAEIAPEFGIKPPTLISWAEHPGRLRRKRRPQ